MHDIENLKKINKPKHICKEPCPVERAMRILGGKWKASIIWCLKDGGVRFNELSRMMGGASKKVLTERLQSLEEEGLVNRNVISTKPIAVEYSLTKLGESSLDILGFVAVWAKNNNL